MRGILVCYWEGWYYLGIRVSVLQNILLLLSGLHTASSYTSGDRNRNRSWNRTISSRTGNSYSSNNKVQVVGVHSSYS